MGWKLPFAHHGLLVAGIAAALGIATSSTEAQPAGAPADAPERDRVTRAEAAFRRAGAAFDAGDLQTALTEYRESYALWPRPRTLLNLGVVLRQLGRPAEAANLLAEYVDVEPADSSKVAAARKTLATLDRELARVSISARGDGELTLDGKALDPEVLRRPVRVTPGRHRISQGDDVQEISVKAGDDTTVEVGGAEPSEATDSDGAAVAVPARATPATPAAAAAVRRASPRRLYLWTGGFTVLAGAATGGLAYRFLQQQEELDDILASPRDYELSEAEDARDRAQRGALLTNVGIGVTAAAAVATVVLFVLHDGEGAPPVVTSAGPGHVTLSLAGHW
jgi:tetratricopeptide (TPR) repeat protein